MATKVECLAAKPPVESRKGCNPPKVYVPSADACINIGEVMTQRHPASSAVATSTTSTTATVDTLPFKKPNAKTDKTNVATTIKIADIADLDLLSDIDPNASTTLIAATNAETQQVHNDVKKAIATSQEATTPSTPVPAPTTLATPATSSPRTFERKSTIAAPTAKGITTPTNAEITVGTSGNGVFGTLSTGTYEKTTKQKCKEEIDPKTGIKSCILDINASELNAPAQKTKYQSGTTTIEYE